MNVSVIRDDRVVVVDGVGHGPISMDGVSPSVRAIQWNGIGGHIEYDGGANEPISDFAKFQFLLDRWEDARVLRDHPELTDNEARAQKCSEIDAITEMVVTKGFVYAGQRVRLSPEDQRNYEVIHSVPEAFSWPIKVKAWADVPWAPQMLEFVDHDEFSSFYRACLDHIRRHLEYGIAMKTSLASMSRREIEAFSDDRGE